MLAEENRLYTVDEFYAMTESDEQSELINGKIFSMSPPPNIRHQRLSGSLYLRIGNYIREHGGNCQVFAAPTGVKLNENTNVQPDIFVVCDPDKLDEQKCNGAPDWVIEILSPSDIRRDTVEKLDLYFKAGVREYWIVDPMTEKVIVYPFGSRKMTGIFTFDDDITAEIYKDMPEPLVIRLRDL